MRKTSSSASTVYRIDTNEYVDYYYKVYLCQTLCFGLPNLVVLPCVTSNLRDFANAVSVRVTSTHVNYVREKIATCWRISCCDQGRIEKNIPLDKITDVVLQEPAGGCPPQTLYTLNIQTASNSGAVGAELSITGLPEDKARELRERILSRSQSGGGGGRPRGGVTMTRT